MKNTHTRWTRKHASSVLLMTCLFAYPVKAREIVHNTIGRTVAGCNCTAHEEIKVAPLPGMPDVYAVQAITRKIVAKDGSILHEKRRLYSEKEERLLLSEFEKDRMRRGERLYLYCDGQHVYTFVLWFSNRIRIEHAVVAGGKLKESQVIATRSVSNEGIFKDDELPLEYSAPAIASGSIKDVSDTDLAIELKDKAGKSYEARISFPSTFNRRTQR